MADPGRAELRERFRAIRRGLAEHRRIELDRSLRVRLLDVLDRRRPGTVALSVPIDGEADVAELAPRLRTAGWTVALPVVDPERSGRMEFHPWSDGATSTRNRFGIPEPERGTPIRPASIDVVVVPAVAVDASGHRLGFGGGFYDRMLAERSDGSLVVVAVYDEQVAEQIPAEPHDVTADVVVTPTRTIRVDESAR